MSRKRCPGVRGRCCSIGMRWGMMYRVVAPGWVRQSLQGPACGHLTLHPAVVIPRCAMPCCAERAALLCAAAADYCVGVKQLAPLADYLVINISSPNTPGGPETLPDVRPHPTPSLHAPLPPPPPHVHHAAALGCTNRGGAVGQPSPPPPPKLR